MTTPSEFRDYVISRNKFTNDKGCWLIQPQYNTTYKSANYKGYNGALHILSAIVFLNHERGSGLIVCHKCDIKGCFNPDHLFIGTSRSNHLDAMRKGRKLGSDFKSSDRTHPVYGEFIETFETELNKSLDFIFGFLCPSAS